MEQSSEYREQLLESYKQAVRPLLPYLPWLEQSAGKKLDTAKDVEPGSSAWLLAGISVGCTIGAAVVTVLVLRLHARLKKRRKTAKHHNKA